MAQKLLKAGGKRKVAAKRPVKKTEDGSVVLVGTYHEKQLDWIKKSGVYNYPVKDGNDGRARTPAAPQDGNLIEFASKVKELWLYAGAKAKRHCFAAEFVGIQSKAEFLAANPTYAKKVGRPSHAQYAVFKIKPFDYGPKLEGKTVVARAIDFAKGQGQTKKIAAAIRQFHADGEFALLAAYLPKELGEVPRQQLRVCEAAVQLDFFPKMLKPVEALKIKTKPKFTFIDLFAGCGGLSLGLERAGFTPLLVNELNPDALSTYLLNRRDEFPWLCDNNVSNVKDLVLNEKLLDGFQASIKKDFGIDIYKGQLDLICGGPPCQGFSGLGIRRSYSVEKKQLPSNYLALRA